MQNHSDLKAKLSKSYTQALKSDNGIVAGNAWRYYLKEELDLDLDSQTNLTWTQIKPYFDIALVDYSVGYLSKSNYDLLASKLIGIMKYEDQFRLQYAMLSRPNSELANEYFRTEILAHRLFPGDSKQPHKRWQQKINGLVDEYVSSSRFKEGEFRKAAKAIMQAYYAGKFSQRALLQILAELTTRVDKQFHEFDDQELGQLLLFFEEACHFQSIAYADKYVNIKQVLEL